MFSTSARTCGIFFFFFRIFLNLFINGLLKGTATIQGVGGKLLSITRTRQSILVSSIQVCVCRGGVLVGGAAIGKSHRNRPVPRETSPIHPLNLSPRRRFLQQEAWGASRSAQTSPSPRPRCQRSRCFLVHQRCPTAVFAWSSGKGKGKGKMFYFQTIMYFGDRRRRSSQANGTLKPRQNIEAHFWKQKNEIDLTMSQNDAPVSQNCDRKVPYYAHFQVHRCILDSTSVPVLTGQADGSDCSFDITILSWRLH